MKVSVAWLKEYLDLKLSPQKCATLLTMSGIGVEAVEGTDGDTRLTLEITSNRPDCLSHIGIARELSSLGEMRLKIPAPADPKKAAQLKPFRLDIQDRDLCPLYIARVVQDIRVGESPAWLKHRLESIGIRSVNNIVDVTNYVMFEIGQPLHAFDYDVLADGAIVVRRARGGEKIVAIDGHEYALNANHLVIADTRQPVAIAGVMGGKFSEISAKTRHVVIESASFDPASIRKTSRQLGLASDSSYRFERGVTPEQVDWASRRAAQLIAELTGGTLGEVIAVPAKFKAREARPLSIRPSRVNQVTGLDLRMQDMVRLLKRLHFVVKKSSGDTLTVHVPPHRRDITVEVDAIEEITRVYGYNNIPTDLNIPVALPPRTHAEQVERRAREILTGAGFQEVLTLPFADPAADGPFSYWSSEDPIGLKDPMGTVDRWLRKSTAPSLLGVAAVNESYKEPLSDVFEIAKIYYRKGNRPVEKNCLALMSAGGFRRLKGVVQALLADLGCTSSVALSRQIFPYSEGGESASWEGDKNLVGWLAGMAAEVREKRGIRSPLWIAEIDFDWVTGKANLQGRFKDFSRYPAVTRDLALVVEDSVSWESIHQRVMEVKPPTMRDVRFFDLYRGPNIPKNKKSIAFSMCFQTSDRTLASQEVDAEVQKVLAHLTKTTGAVLR